METTITTLKISKSDFENAVPAAFSKNNDVFDMLTDAICRFYNDFSLCILGDCGKNAAEGDNSRLKALAKSYVCQSVFLDNIRHLDLVLTSTGFGVVATQDVTPASKARVDALYSAVDKQAAINFGLLLDELFKISGWDEQTCLVTGIFYCFRIFVRYSGFAQPTVADWRAARPLIEEAEALLTRKISREQMNALTKALRTNTLTKIQNSIVIQMQQLIGAHISGNKSVESELYKSLMNSIEDNLSDFAEYAGSSAYRTNHFEGYENTKESSAFFFQG